MFKPKPLTRHLPIVIKPHFDFLKIRTNTDTGERTRMGNSLGFLYSSPTFDEPVCPYSNMEWATTRYLHFIQNITPMLVARVKSYSPLRVTYEGAESIEKTPVFKVPFLSYDIVPFVDMPQDLDQVIPVTRITFTTISCTGHYYGIIIMNNAKLVPNDGSLPYTNLIQDQLKEDEVLLYALRLDNAETESIWHRQMDTFSSSLNFLLTFYTFHEFITDPESIRESFKSLDENHLTYSILSAILMP